MKGERTVTAQEMWKAYCMAMGTEETEYEAWPFGDDPDMLAALVLAGKKRATSSAYDLYALEGENIPEKGDKSVILNSRDEAVCIIENTAVSVLPYDEVTPEMAAMEGEGDGSQAYWRQVHERFFRQDMAQSGLCFHEKMPVVFEQFRVIWPVKKG